MRSISLKLSLAFLAVGVIGIVLVAAFVRLQTQREFDQFVLNQFQTNLVEELAAYYQANGSWENIHAILVRNPDSNNMAGGRPSRYWAPVTLLDEDRSVVYGGVRYQNGQVLPKKPGELSAPIEVNGETVGWVLFETSYSNNAPPLTESPESIFLKNMKL